MSAFGGKADIDSHVAKWRFGLRSVPFQYVRRISRRGRHNRWPGGK